MPFGNGKNFKEIPIVPEKDHIIPVGDASHVLPYFRSCPSHRSRQLGQVLALLPQSLDELACDFLASTFSGNVPLYLKQVICCLIKVAQSVHELTLTQPSLNQPPEFQRFLHPCGFHRVG